MGVNFISLILSTMLPTVKSSQFKSLDQYFSTMSPEFTWNIKIDGIWKDDLDDGHSSCCWWGGDFCIREERIADLEKTKTMAAMYKKIPEEKEERMLTKLKFEEDDKLIDVKIKPIFYDKVTSPMSFKIPSRRFGSSAWLRPTPFLVFGSGRSLIT